jgi:hypothetical protein
MEAKEKKTRCESKTEHRDHSFPFSFFCSVVWHFVTCFNKSRKSLCTLRKRKQNIKVIHVIVRVVGVREGGGKALDSLSLPLKNKKRRKKRAD